MFEFVFLKSLNQAEIYEYTEEQSKIKCFGATAFNDQVTMIASRMNTRTEPKLHNKLHFPP